MKLKTPQDIPTGWKVFNVKRKTTVKVRRCAKAEKFKVSWQDAELISDPKNDLIIIQDNGKEYPCKKDIFNETYELVDTNPLIIPPLRRYRKTATTRIVEIPEGINVEIETLEGVLPIVTYPDYIAIGAKGELYANTKQFVEENLEIV